MEQRRGGRRPVIRGFITAEVALRSWVGVSTLFGSAAVVVALAISWLLSYVVGGAASVVPHWYYAPIMFTAARFGLLPAVVVAVVSGFLAGPLTYLEVATATPQATDRWLTRMAFFVGGAITLSLLVRPSMPSIVRAIQNLREERAVREALDDGELFVRYQPIVELATGRLYGFEALVRWQHPEHGELGPDRIIGPAERCDVIHDLGLFVLRQACQAQVAWSHSAAARDEPPPCVTVNMSTIELQSEHLTRRMRDVLAETGVDPAKVCIEITESALADDLDLSVARLAGLRTLGVKIAVDDFGTGYSSLAAVHRFPIDVMKIDRTFIEGLDRFENTAKLIGGLVLLARVLELTVIAEGIEHDRAATTLRDLDVTLGQGFHFSKPITRAEADDLVATSRIADALARPIVAGERDERDLSIRLDDPTFA